MAATSDLTGAGLPALLASLLGTTYAAVSAAGSATGDATVIKKAQTLIELTATGADGVRLPSDADVNAVYIIANTSGSSGIVYPPTGGTINGGTSETLTTTIVGVFIRMTNTKWAGLLGA